MEHIATGCVWKNCCGFGNLREEFVEETWIKAAKEHGLGNPEGQLLQVSDSSGWPRYALSLLWPSVAFQHGLVVECSPFWGEGG